MRTQELTNDMQKVPINKQPMKPITRCFLVWNVAIFTYFTDHANINKLHILHGRRIEGKANVLTTDQLKLMLEMLLFFCMQKLYPDPNLWHIWWYYSGPCILRPPTLPGKYGLKLGIQSFCHTVLSSQLLLCDELTGGWWGRVVVVRLGVNDWPPQICLFLILFP